MKSFYMRTPRKVWQDFDDECKRRRLSTHGVMRDLMICWIVANVDGWTAQSYAEMIADDLSGARDRVLARNLKRAEREKAKRAELHGSKEAAAKAANKEMIAKALHCNRMREMATPKNSFELPNPHRKPGRPPKVPKATPDEWFDPSDIERRGS